MVILGRASDALKVLVGLTIACFVLAMIVQPAWRSNPLGVLAGSFVLMLLVTAFIYAGGEERPKVWRKKGPVNTRPFAEPSRGPVTIIKEREVIKEVVLVPCKYCGSLMPQTSLFCPHCAARVR
jgi:hypothetical protein